MHYRFRRVSRFRQEEFVKIYFFYQLRRTEITFRKCILFFRKRMNRACRFVLPFTGAGDQFGVDAQAQAPRCQDPRRDSSLDRAGRALRELNHGRTAGGSIAMPPVRSIG